MSRDISDIPGLSGKTLVLFRASGFVNVGSLVDHSVNEIERMLAKTNDEYGIVGWLPSPSAVRAWVSTARLLENEGTEEENGPMSEEAMAEMREVATLVARPVLVSELQEAGVVVDAVPIAQFVGDSRVSRSGRRDVRHWAVDSTPDRERREDAGDKESTPGVMSKGETAGIPVKLTEAAVAKERGKGAADISTDRDEDVDEESEAARMNFRDTESLTHEKRKSERRNHGMTHKLPKRAFFSALVTFWTMTIGWLSVFVVLGLAGYFVANDQAIPVWLLYGLLVIPVCVLLYLVIGLRARCRLCGYRLFVAKACRKHESAHQSIFGSVYATAFHLLTRGTWRCMYCGTKQKLK